MQSVNCDRCKRGDANRLLIPMYGGAYRQIDLCTECADVMGDLLSIFFRTIEIDDLFRRYLKSREPRALLTHH